MKPLLLARPLTLPNGVVLKNRIGKTVKGPDTATRDKLTTCVWGEASNAKGEKKTARIKTANGYSLTVSGSLAVTEFLLNNTVTGGAYTPSKLMGADLVTRLPGSSNITLS